MKRIDVDRKKKQIPLFLSVFILSSSEFIGVISSVLALWLYGGVTMDVTPVVHSVTLPSGVTLPYAEQGDPSGVPMLFLHAVGDSWRTFEPLLHHLPPSIHAIAPSQRGHGDASRPETGYRVPDFVADLAAFMDALRLPAAVIVGGSSGGLIARRFAVVHPARTLGLVLLGSPATLRNKPAVQEAWDTTLSKLTDPMDPAFVRQFALSTLARPVSPEFLGTMVQESLKVPARVWRDTMAGILEEEFPDDLGKIAAPTLLIWGDRDAILPLSDQQALAAAIPGARLVIYPGAGHAFYWEEPAPVAADLAAFVRTLA
jgi:non-heme chloroperoxidase